MDRADLDSKIKAYQVAQKAHRLERTISKIISSSPREAARDRLRWLERRALAGGLGPHGDLREYDAQAVREVIDKAHGSQTTRPTPVRW